MPSETSTTRLFCARLYPAVSLFSVHCITVSVNSTNATKRQIIEIHSRNMAAGTVLPKNTKSNRQPPATLPSILLRRKFPPQMKMPIPVKNRTSNRGGDKTAFPERSFRTRSKTPKKRKTNSTNEGENEFRTSDRVPVYLTMRCTVRGQRGSGGSR